MNNQLKALSESRRVEDTGQSRSMPMYKIFNTILVLIIDCGLYRDQHIHCLSERGMPERMGMPTSRFWRLNPAHTDMQWLINRWRSAQKVFQKIIQRCVIRRNHGTLKSGIFHTILLLPVSPQGIRTRRSWHRYATGKTHRILLPVSSVHISHFGFLRIP